MEGVEKEEEEKLAAKVHLCQPAGGPQKRHGEPPHDTFHNRCPLNGDRNLSVNLYLGQWGPKLRAAVFLLPHIVNVDMQ